METGNTTETVEMENTTETVEMENTTESVGAKNLSPIEIGNAPEATNRAKNIDMKTVRAKNFLPLHGTSRTIGSIVHGFKIGVTKYVRQQIPDKRLWQHKKALEGLVKA